MEVIDFIIFIICAIITFKAKDKRFPNHPYLGWIVCMVGLGVCLYLIHYFGDKAVEKEDFNAGYREAFK